MKTVFVLVDALKSAYLQKDYMPFLYQFAEENLHVEKIIPSPGFCERCEIFSGLDCFNTGNFTAIGYDPFRSYYKNKGFSLYFAELISKINPKIAKFFLRKYRDLKKLPLKPYRIPFRSLSNYVLTEDGSHKYVQFDTIFEILDKAGMKYTLNGFTALSDINKKAISNHIEFLKQSLKEGMDFIPIYIGEIDAIGHKFGNNIECIKPYLKKIDDILARLFAVSNEFGAKFCVLGDHGMVPVKHRINLSETLKMTGLKIHQDYELFLDSTIARFWSSNKKNLETIRLFLENKMSGAGFCITPDISTKYRIPMDIKGLNGSNVYGDMIWAAHPGILISPDYFHASYPQINGMHGYIELDYVHGTGLFCSNISSEKIQTKHLYEIIDFLSTSLEVDVPNRHNWSRKNV